MGFALGFDEGLFGPGTGSFHDAGVRGRCSGWRFARPSNYQSAEPHLEPGALALFIPGRRDWPVAGVMIVGLIVGMVWLRLTGAGRAKVIPPLVNKVVVGGAGGEAGALCGP